MSVKKRGVKMETDRKTIETIRTILRELRKLKYHKRNSVLSYLLQNVMEMDDVGVTTNFGLTNKKIQELMEKNSWKPVKGLFTRYEYYERDKLVRVFLPVTHVSPNKKNPKWILAKHGRGSIKLPFEGFIGEFDKYILEHGVDPENI